jgi:hypothetical protein
MTISQMDSFGLIAAILQVAGYAIYIRNFRRDTIKPNAASFFMFAYGTSLLAFLEWKSGASLALLALPFTCAALGALVALMCLRAGATEPIDRFEARAFWTDIWLTVFYMFFALGLGDAQHFVVPFLIVTNLSAIVCFVQLGKRLNANWQGHGLSGLRLMRCWRLLRSARTVSPIQYCCCIRCSIWGCTLRC